MIVVFIDEVLWAIGLIQGQRKVQGFPRKHTESDFIQRLVASRR